MKNPSSWKCKGHGQQHLYILNDYLTAYKEVFPEAWDNKNYVLTKTMGFDIIFSICNQLTLNAVDISGVNRLRIKMHLYLSFKKYFLQKMTVEIWYQSRLSLMAKMQFHLTGKAASTVHIPVERESIS